MCKYMYRRYICRYCKGVWSGQYVQRHAHRRQESDMRAKNLSTKRWCHNCVLGTRKKIIPCREVERHSSRHHRCPRSFSNDAFCDVNFKHFKSPYYKCIKKKQGKTLYVHVVNKTDTLIFKKNDNKSSYSLQRGISNGRCLSCTFTYFPSKVSNLMYFFSLSFKIDFDKISHVIIRPLKNDERIWYSKYDIPMNSSKSLFHEIVLDKDQNEIINEDIYMTTFK